MNQESIQNLEALTRRDTRMLYYTALNKTPQYVMTPPDTIISTFNIYKKYLYEDQLDKYGQYIGYYLPLLVPHVCGRDINGKKVKTYTRDEMKSLHINKNHLLVEIVRHGKQNKHNSYTTKSARKN